MRAIRTLATPYARHTHALRVCWINGVGKMHRSLAQLQKLAENEHFLCKGRSEFPDRQLDRVRRAYFNIVGLGTFRNNPLQMSVRSHAIEFGECVTMNSRFILSQSSYNSFCTFCRNTVNIISNPIQYATI